MITKVEIREEMEKCGADYILETAQELLDIV